jgi:hypothetical protein
MLFVEHGIKRFVDREKKHRHTYTYIHTKRFQAHKIFTDLERNMYITLQTMEFIQ